MSVSVLMTGKLDYNDAHTNWVCACSKLCLTTCFLTSMVQVIEASASICDPLTTTHSSVLHHNANGSSAPPALMLVFNRLALSFAPRIQQKWFGNCTYYSSSRDMHLHYTSQTCWWQKNKASTDPWHGTNEDAHASNFMASVMQQQVKTCAMGCLPRYTQC